MSFIECLIATAILSIAVLAFAYAVTGGSRQSAFASDDVRAARVAEQLLEEIASRPYTGTGVSRASWCQDDYDGFTEAPGTLVDAAGKLLDDPDQVFARSCEVASGALVVPGLSSSPIPGRSVTVTIHHALVSEWAYTRFVPEEWTP